MEKVGERIGIGRTAEVFRLGDDRVLKLLLPGFPDELGLREAEIGELVNVAVGAAPRFLGSIRLDGRLGLVYQRVDGPTMLDELTAHPWSLFRLADELATLHSDMHAADGTGLPAMRDYLRRQIGHAEPVAGPDAARAALDRMAALRDGRAVCHGDMHPGNVIRAASGPVVIDWMTARAGPAEADVARTLHLLLGSAVPATTPRLRRLVIGYIRRSFTNRYLRTYRHRNPVGADLILAWRLPILVARLAEEIAEEEPGIRAAVAKELSPAGR